MTGVFPRPVIFFISALLAAIIIPGGSAAEDLNQNRQNLKEIRSRIKKTEEDFQRKRSAEKSLSAELADVEREIKRVEGEILDLTRKNNLLKKDLSRTRSEVQQLDSDLSVLQGHLRKRITAMYKSGRSGPLRAFFSAESPTIAAEDYDFLSRIVRRDRDLQEEYRQHSRNLKTKMGELEKLRQEHEKVLQSISSRKEDRRQVLLKKERILARVQQERVALGGRLKDLKEREKRLSVLIKKLESQKSREYTQKGDFASQKGRLQWPAAGNLKKRFGTGKDPRSGTLLESQGIEIAVPGGRPVKAVWSGKVVFANWFKGYGNLLILDHDNGYFSLYAQTERLTRKVGDSVRVGEDLAYSDSGEKGLYFEIRHQGTPLDPGAWLSPRP